jgi:hypothetical protein
VTGSPSSSSINGDTKLHAEIKHQTTPELRKFGVTVGLAFLVFGAIAHWRHPDGLIWKVLVSAGALLLVAGLLIPAQLQAVYRGWMKFALLLSKVTTPIFMGIVYFGLFLVTGLIRRAMGKNAMETREVNGSYWSARDVRRANLERQF